MVSCVVWKKQVYYQNKEKEKKPSLGCGQLRNEVLGYSKVIQVGRNIHVFEV